MRLSPRRSLSLIALLATISVLAACSAAAPQSSPRTVAAAPTSAPAAAPQSGVASDSALGASGSKSAAAAPTSVSAQGTSPSSSGTVVSWDRMIIRNANLALTVNDVEATLGSIRDIAQASGGYVATSQSQYVGEKVNATITLQVPATSFDGVVQQIEKLALKVDTEQVTSQDITEEFVDDQAQIANLKATEQTMVRLLDRATQMDEILAIQRELTSVRGQIEKLQGRVNYLQRRSDFSTITIRVSPVSTPIDPNASTTWQPLRTISQAWQASLEAITTVVDVLLAIVFYLWWLIAIVALAVWLWRRGHRRPQTPAPVPAAAAGPSPSAPPPASPGAG